MESWCASTIKKLAAMHHECWRERVTFTGFPKTLPSQDIASKMEALKMKLLVKLFDLKANLM
jgi:hypothetical protein